MLLALATVGTGAWAMGESIKQTNDVISSFWDVIDQVEATVGVSLVLQWLGGAVVSSK